MEEKEKIIIVGYPKSGNTWVTRLTAELANCPIKGFLYEKDNSEISIEGLNRTSIYECYKSHHQYQELLDEDRQNAKIIYVVRDPRDIVLSGTNYFYNLNPLKVYHFKNVNFTYLVNLINRSFKKLVGRRIMQKRMINAVINGDARVHHWCRVSWKNHLTPYLKKGSVLVIKYEALLQNPEGESLKIVRFLDIKKNDKEIKKAIKIQSFENVKNKFLTNQQLPKANFLRKGLAAQWRKDLSRSEKELFLMNLRPEIEKLGYKLE